MKVKTITGTVEGWDGGFIQENGTRHALVRFMSRDGEVVTFHKAFVGHEVGS